MHWVLFQILEEMLAVAATATFALLSATLVVDGARLVADTTQKAWSEPSVSVLLLCLAACVAVAMAWSAEVELAARVIANAISLMRTRARDRGMFPVAHTAIGGLLIAVLTVAVMGAGAALLVTGTCFALLPLLF